MILICQGSRSTSASCPTRSTSPRTSRGARARARKTEAWKRHFSLFDMKYERAVAKVNGKICCAAGHVGFDIGTYHYSARLFFSHCSSMKEKKDHKRDQKMKMLKHESWAHPTFSLLLYKQPIIIQPQAALLWRTGRYYNLPPDSVFVCYVDVRITTE